MNEKGIKKVVEQNEKRDVSQRNSVYKSLDEWAGEKGYESYEEWYFYIMTN